MGCENLGRQESGCLPLPYWKARGQNFLQHRQPSLLSPDIAICGQMVGVGEHTIPPGTSVLTQFPVCTWACVCRCVCHPPAHMHTPLRAAASPSELFSPWKSGLTSLLFMLQKNTGLSLYKEPQGSLHWPSPRDV